MTERSGTRPPPPVTYAAAPTRFLRPTAGFRYGDAAFAVLIIAAIGLVVVPDLITYLTVEHSPILPPGEAATTTDLPLAQLASLGGSALLLLASTVVVFLRGHPDRNISGVFLLLLAVNLPYLLSPSLPPPADLPKIALANVFIVALWNLGAPIAGLRWIPITVAVISVYSLIGGLIVPELMMYNAESEKAIIPGWELAGPFGHANVLGMFCVVAFALVPLITETRWRIGIGVILLVTLLAAASRTALIAAALIILWWILCRFRSVLSIRLAGTVMASGAAVAMLVFPFLNWDPDAFTERAFVWAQSLAVWRDSPMV
ncbi:MAG: lipid core-O-antigen ligase-like enyme, partial [Mycobacterium sp.]|nr:lipid core-O-antigen ligase-like enyme [Mycobacterium sp.]